MRKLGKRNKSDHVIAYVDGANLYYGIRDAFRRQNQRRTTRHDHYYIYNKKYYWLDIPSLLKSYLRPHQELVEIKYFTAPVIKEKDPNKAKRQNIWLDALKSFDIIEIFKGFYLSKPVTCKNCGHTFTKMEEKKTDVNISVQMLTDCFQKKVDVIFLVTGDTDLVPPLKMIRKNFPHIWIIILSPPKRQNNELKDKSISHHYLTIGKAKIRKYQLSNTITLKNGVNISKPEEWSDPES